ncbi:class I SAM-dependent methyltransferase [Caulobacter sp. CCG-8]|uniref:class I SAM-dependent methyltransferase n=1 Tax=Caulobacter sp. CCG-8 TaxID=3127958 RepID=UPI00307D0990
MSDPPFSNDPNSNGWAESAAAWIADMGEHGDYGRRYVLDPVIRQRLGERGFRKALDVGCGEGRLCRMLSGFGVETIGLDPTQALLDQARRSHPEGRYVEGVAEALPFEDAGFDLVVSCLSLIDIPGFEAAIAEMARVLAPGGTLFVANLTSFATARIDAPILERWVNSPGVRIDRYLEQRSSWEAWRGIRIVNWHRPLSAYMAAFLGAGLRLTHFDEPAPVGGDPAKAERYRGVPWYVVMEWEKPA